MEPKQKSLSSFAAGPNTLLGVVGAVSFALLMAVASLLPSNQANSGLLLVMISAFSGGMLLGFLYAPYKDEIHKFNAFFAMLNAALGGFALSDITKAEGLIRRSLYAVAESCGLPHGTGLVGCVVVAFASLGFLAMYLNKRLALNPAIDEVERKMATDPNRLAIGALNVNPTDPGDRPRVPKELQSAVRTIITDPHAGTAESAEILKADAKAFFLTGDYRRASDALRKAHAKSPNDPEVLLLLSNAIIADDSPQSATPYLEKLVKLPDASPNAWKLLGYSYLYEEGRELDSAKASEKYLLSNPDDPGAILNRACAYAQLGPTDASNRQKVLGIVTELIKDHPEWKLRVAELTSAKEDFFKWKDIPEFKALLR